MSPPDFVNIIKNVLCCEKSTAILLLSVNNKVLARIEHFTPATLATQIIQYYGKC